MQPLNPDTDILPHFMSAIHTQSPWQDAVSNTPHPEIPEHDLSSLEENTTPPSIPSRNPERPTNELSPPSQTPTPSSITPPQPSQPSFQASSPTPPQQQQQQQQNTSNELLLWTIRRIFELHRRHSHKDKDFWSRFLPYIIDDAAPSTCMRNRVAEEVVNGLQKLRGEEREMRRWYFGCGVVCGWVSGAVLKWGVMGDSNVD